MYKELRSAEGFTLYLRFQVHRLLHFCIFNSVTTVYGFLLRVYVFKPEKNYIMRSINSGDALFFAAEIPADPCIFLDSADIN
jgi:hypothetical protein